MTTWEELIDVDVDVSPQTRDLAKTREQAESYYGFFERDFCKHLASLGDPAG